MVPCIVVAVGLGPRFDQLPESDAAGAALTLIGDLPIPSAILHPQTTLTETGVEISWRIDEYTVKTDILVRQPPDSGNS